MEESGDRLFIHHKTRDGYLSICIRCFLTAARTTDEIDLSGIEKDHICDEAQAEIHKELSERYREQILG